MAFKKLLYLHTLWQWSFAQRNTVQKYKTLLKLKIA